MHKRDIPPIVLRCPQLARVAGREGCVAAPMESRTTWAWAVLDHEGSVVVLVSGQGAWAEAQEWAARGYRVTDIELYD